VDVLELKEKEIEKNAFVSRLGIHRERVIFRFLFI
jgi:hypothetical protein